MNHGLQKNSLEWVKLIVCLALTLILHFIDGNKIMMLIATSDQLSDALTGILTFTTLILGFIGVLLPAIMGMKKESDLVGKFFRRVSPKRFSAFVRNNILAGLLLTMCVVVMFFAKDLLENQFSKTAMFISWATVFFSIYFIVTTFCVLNLLLRLLVEDSQGEAYPKG